MSHENFEKILLQSSLSNSEGTKQPVRIQWDPERTASTRGKLPYRSIQIGIGRNVAEVWAKEMILSIEDVTTKAQEMYQDDQNGMSVEELAAKYISERVYEVHDEELRKIIRLDAKPEEGELHHNNPASTSSDVKAEGSG